MKPSRDSIIAERSFSLKSELLLAGANHVAFTPQEDLMAIARTDMTVDLFVKGEYSRSFEVSSRDQKVRPTQRIRGLAFGNLGDRLLLASADQVRSIALAPGAPSWTVVPPRSFGFLVSSPLSIAVNDLGYVAASFDNGSIGVWTPHGSNLFLRREANAPRCIDFADNDDLVIGTDGFSLCSWDAARGRPRLKLLLDDRTYTSASWRKGRLVAVRGLSTVRVMEIENGTELWSRRMNIGLPLITFDQQTGRLAVSEEHGVTVFDSSGAELMRRDLEGGAVTAIAFTPKSGEVVVGKSDGDIEFLPVQA